MEEIKPRRSSRLSKSTELLDEKSGKLKDSNGMSVEELQGSMGSQEEDFDFLPAKNIKKRNQTETKSRKSSSVQLRGSDGESSSSDSEGEGEIVDDEAEVQKSPKQTETSSNPPSPSGSLLINKTKNIKQEEKETIQPLLLSPLPKKLKVEEKKEDVTVLSEDSDEFQQTPIKKETSLRGKLIARKSSLATPKKIVIDLEKEEEKEEPVTQEKKSTRKTETKEEKKERLKKAEEEIKRRRLEREKKKEEEVNKPKEKEETKEKKSKESKSKKEAKKSVKAEVPLGKQEESDDEGKSKAKKAAPKKRKQSEKKVFLEVKEKNAKGKKNAKKSKKNEENSESESSADENNNNANYAHNPQGLAHGGRRRKNWEDQARFARLNFNEKKNDGIVRTAKPSPFAEDFATPQEITDLSASSSKKKGRVQNKARMPAKIDSLQTMCLKLLTEYIDCVESFGLLPPVLQDGLCALLARHQKFTPAVLDLFLEPDMTVLYLSNCSELDPRTLATIARCQHLEILSIAGCGRLTDDALTVIAENCPLLREVNLDGCYGIKNPSLQKLAETHPKLEKLSLSWIERFNADFVVTLATSCPLLTNITLVQCVQLTDSMLEPLSFLNNLQNFKIEGSPLVSDRGIEKALSSSSESMKNLEVVNCELVTGDGIAKILQSFKHLEGLSIEGVADIMNEHLVQVAIFCPNLQRIRLSGCGLYNNEGIVAVAKGCNRLLKVSICKNAHVNKSGIEELTKGCPDLKELDLSWCREMDDFVIEHLMLNLRKLQKITLWGCSRVTDLAVRVMLRKGIEVVGKDQYAIL